MNTLISYMSITDATQKIKVGFVLDGDWVYTLDFVVRKVFYEEVTWKLSSE